MDKSTIFYSHLLVIGAIICMTTAVSLRHKRSVIPEYHWPEPGPPRNFPEPNPEINQFPHETTCHYYYLVLSEEDITLNKCPDGELFDYIDHQCSGKETARCWSHHFGKMRHHHHIPLKSEGPFRCPYAWGKYPDIKDCTKYYVCLSGKVKHKKCAPFEHFDKVSRKCVATIDGVCADETDVMDPDYKCPRTWGSFSFSEDCSKYYECLERKPNLRTCPTDTLFHERKEKCLPLNHVHCGSRRNPYSKKEETSIINESTHPENIKITSSGKETESDVKIASAKTSTIDPNSIIIERIPSVPNPAETTQPPNDRTTGELSSSNFRNLTSLSKTESTDLPAKQSVSNETESLLAVTEITSVNDIDKVTDNDDDSENTDEFIEISTKTSSLAETKISNASEPKTSKSSETKTFSSSETEASSLSEIKSYNPPVTQTVTLDSSDTKTRTGVIKDEFTTSESPQATASDECSAKDPTCITEESGRIIRCPAAEGQYPYPEDERRFLLCKNSNIRVRYCSGDMIFNSKTKKCVANMIF